MSTPTERADEMARLVIAAAQQDNDCVVTRDLVDTVVKMHADTEPGKANPVSVRRADPGPCGGGRCPCGPDRR
ncbi:hypothetical protein R2F25_38815 [Streptomyces sp. UP1A-1]|nr:hypothetical protein [Streptomyces sp. UP1A-1]